jgi:hypothetical protein
MPSVTSHVNAPGTSSLNESPKGASPTSTSSSAAPSSSANLPKDAGLAHQQFGTLSSFQDMSREASVSRASDTEHLPSSMKAPGTEAFNAKNGIQEAQKLLDSYLSGKLSQGELAHKLRNHNSVLADSIIKEGKRAPVSAIAYQEVTRTTMNRPGGDMYPESPDKTQPKKGLGGYGPGAPDEDQAREEVKKEEIQERKDEQKERRINEEIIEQDKEATESHQRHQEAEEEREEKRKEELGIDTDAGMESLAHVSFGTVQRSKLAASAASERRSMIMKELQLQRERSNSDGSGASTSDRSGGDKGSKDDTSESPQGRVVTHNGVTYDSEDK